MMERGPGVDVIINDEIMEKSPHCPHGPTLLFERFTWASNVKKSQENKRFYSCSACRDRKQCAFYRLESDHSKRSDSIHKTNDSNRLPVKTMDGMSRLEEYKKLSVGDRRFCVSCGLLLLQKEWKIHDNHKITQNIGNEELSSPSRLLDPIENSKKEAQFFFSDSTTKFIVSTLEKLTFCRILCVGTPRIHEFCRNSGTKCDSLFLDIDERFKQFYDAKSFCHYNMFNHFFFDGESSRQTFTNFMKKGRMAIVMDPPFGGLIEVLTYVISTITKEYENESSQTFLPVFWIYPYFMEPRMLQCLPNFTMLDYKVGYDNNPMYATGPGQTNCHKKSPIRIFTNIPANEVKLPKSEGYRFCSLCNRWVSEENRHCKICKACTSKDGSTYVHCDTCNRCVKPSRIHCVTCGRCQPQDHKCKKMDQLSGCHVCGDFTHKRRSCPNKNHFNRKKRTASSKIPRISKKKKHSF